MGERIRFWLQSVTTLVRSAFVESEQKGRAIATRRREQLVARIRRARDR